MQKKLSLKSRNNETRIARLEYSFNLAEQLVQSVIDGGVKNLIIRGEPGIGKSYIVDRIEEQMTMHDDLKKNSIPSVYGNWMMIAQYIQRDVKHLKMLILMNLNIYR